jgi:GT2 family glycosyltransferase
VIVPFRGSDEEAVAALAALDRLELREGDELIVADNTAVQVAARHSGDHVTVVDAGAVQSSYFARNLGAERARNDWLLFIDADCRPSAELLDAYFRAELPARCGAVAGEVTGSPEQRSLTARYSRSRRHIGQADLQKHEYKPMAVTANLLVRRDAWQDVGGFHEGIRSSGDADFSWRIQDAGWTLGYSAEAEVEHLHRESLRAMVRQAARYGAGRTWLRRRHPLATFPKAIPALARCAVGVVVWTLTLRFERALFKALDAVWVGAESLGALIGNRAADVGRGEPGVVVVFDRFPECGDQSAKQMSSPRAGMPSARVEAVERAAQPELGGGRGLQVSYLEDDGIAARWRDLAWLASRHPVRCMRDAAMSRKSAARLPLRSLAPAARRFARNGDRELRGVGSGAQHAERLGRLLAVPFAELLQHQHAMTQRAASQSAHLDEVVEDEERGRDPEGPRSH